MPAPKPIVSLARCAGVLALGGCLLHCQASANDDAHSAGSSDARRQAVMEASSPARDQFGRLADLPPRETPMARAIGSAQKKDFAQANLQAWSEVLIKCQQATNPAWTTALARSDSQQAHCYRY